MKQILALLVALAFTMPVVATDKAEAPKTKQVCVDAQGKDGKPVLDKNGKPRQNCKTVKIREKHEGTKVPEKKK